MLKQQITPKEVVAFLNELLEVDRTGVSNFFNKRAIINEDLANHPTVQVRKGEGVKFYTMAPLGLLNGLFGCDEDGWGAIYRKVEEDGLIVEFGLVDDELKEKAK